MAVNTEHYSQKKEECFFVMEAKLLLASNKSTALSLIVMVVALVGNDRYVITIFFMDLFHMD